MNPCLDFLKQLQKLSLNPSYKKKKYVKNKEDSLKVLTPLILQFGSLQWLWSPAADSEIP